MDKATGRPRGFAFVTYANEADAEVAMSAMNQHVLDGRPLTVRPAVARGTGSLKDFDDEELDSMMSAAPTAPRVSRPCKFFSTPGGCKNGTACRFQHD